MLNIEHKIVGEAEAIVDSSNTAIAAGSGSLEVFGTPFMIALMEKATCVAVNELLEEGETTVGTAINVSHSKASGVGASIKATATLSPEGIDGRKLTFDVVATEGDGSVIGSGKIQRFVVLIDKFMKRVDSK